MANLKFSDNDLKIFYNNVLSHYIHCTKEQNLDNFLTYQQIYNEIDYLLSAQGHFSSLPKKEKDKIFQAFNGIFYAISGINNSLEKEKIEHFKPLPTDKSKYIYVKSVYEKERYFNSVLLDWLVISSLSNSCRYDSRDRAYTGIHHHRAGTGNIHSHPNNNSKSSNIKHEKNIDVLIIIALGLAAAALAFIALFYMIHQGLNSIERLIYNEGWLKACLMCATSVAFGAASAVLTLNFLVIPLTSLAIVASMNPVGLIIVATICLTTIGAGIGSIAMSFLHDSLQQKLNKDAIDPSDPKRFRLTKHEEDNLLNKGFNPIVVKCVLIAIRAEMSKIQNSEKISESFLSRHFSEGKKIQHLLDLTRKLRSGNVEYLDDKNLNYMVTVGDLTFDCSLPPPSYEEINTHTASL